MSPLDRQDKGIEPGVCLSWPSGHFSHMTTWHLHPLVKQRRWASLHKGDDAEVGPFNFLFSIETYFDRLKHLGRTNTAANSEQHGNEILTVLITAMKFNTDSLDTLLL